MPQGAPHEIAALDAVDGVGTSCPHPPPAACSPSLYVHDEHALDDLRELSFRPTDRGANVWILVPAGAATRGRFPQRRRAGRRPRPMSSALPCDYSTDWAAADVLLSTSNYRALVIPAVQESGPYQFSTGYGGSPGASRSRNHGHYGPTAPPYRRAWDRHHDSCRSDQQQRYGTFAKLGKSTHRLTGFQREAPLVRGRDVGKADSGGLFSPRLQRLLRIRGRLDRPFADTRLLRRRRSFLAENVDQRKQCIGRPVGRVDQVVSQRHPRICRDPRQAMYDVPAQDLR